MTENRCIEVLKKMKHMFTETCAKIDENTALNMAIEAVKENQQYKAIGTIEEFKALKAENAQLHNKAQAINATLDELEKEVRNKAIDEFVERIENHTFTEKTEEYSNSVSFMREIRKIAEELKGGAK